jgi:hypothetical protein
MVRFNFKQSDIAGSKGCTGDQGYICTLAHSLRPFYTKNLGISPPEVFYMHPPHIYQTSSTLYPKGHPISHNPFSILHPAQQTGPCHVSVNSPSDIPPFPDMHWADRIDA